MARIIVGPGRSIGKCLIHLIPTIFRAKGQALGFTGAASHLVGRIPYFSTQPNLILDVAEVRTLIAAYPKSPSLVF